MSFGNINFSPTNFAGNVQTNIRTKVLPPKVDSAIGPMPEDYLQTPPPTANYWACPKEAFFQIKIKPLYGDYAERETIDLFLKGNRNGGSIDGPGACNGSYTITNQSGGNLTLSIRGGTDPSRRSAFRFTVDTETFDDDTYNSEHPDQEPGSDANYIILDPQGTDQPNDITDSVDHEPGTEDDDRRVSTVSRGSDVRHFQRATEAGGVLTKEILETWPRVYVYKGGGVTRPKYVRIHPDIVCPGRGDPDPDEETPEDTPQAGAYQ